MKDLDEKLLDCIDNERVIADEIQQSDEFLSKVYAALHKADEALSTRTTGASAIWTVNLVKLPKLTIHPFSGDITQWTGFWDSFKSSVHSRKTAVHEVLCVATVGMHGLLASQSFYHFVSPPT